MVSQEESQDSCRWDTQSPVTVDIASLCIGDSPRLCGEDMAHIRALAETDAALPPILVHRNTMRVIDGMHRFRAAALRGDSQIEARYFDGSADMAFVLGVEANIAHGLPLSLADREVAAARILAMHPEWSDRAIAKSTGLGATTIGAIRGRAGGLPQVTARVGRDGRVRPLDIGEGRRRAVEIIASQPDASLRQIAKAAGVSLGTARDVRMRLHNGDDPTLTCGRVKNGKNGSVSSIRGLDRGRGGAKPVVPGDVSARLQNLKMDPSMRYSEHGRSTIRWLDAHMVRPTDWTGLVDALPPHCTYVVSELARSCAAAWQELAEELEQRVRPAN
jgi:ParB-like chromosome segregation protein Spo0J